MFHDRRSKRRPLPPRSLPSHRLVSRLLFPKPLFTTLYLSYTLSEHTVGEESPSMTAIMNGHATLPSYAEQFDAFRKHDAARDTLIQDVIRAYEELQLKYTEKCDDYSNEVESRRMWQSKASLNERALNEHRQISGSNSFVVAVIDGDGAIFQDFLYQLGKDGGADAAHQLHAEIKNNMKTAYPDANVDDWSVVVQVILNLQGLASKLVSCGAVASVNDVLEFGRSFGLAQPLFTFIDAGSGKERADHKVRETLRLYLPNAQCKHVFFGPCNDNGYLPVLEGYKRDYASRLTLIETRPAEPGFVALGLRRVRFPRVFRSDNLPGGKPFFMSSPPATVASPPSAPPSRSTSGVSMQPMSASFVPRNPSPAPSADSGNSTWATIGKSVPNPKTIHLATKKVPPRRCILLNVYDERRDAELPRCDTGAERRFAETLKHDGKYCNNFHLTGKCESHQSSPSISARQANAVTPPGEAGEYCDYRHGAKLSPGEHLVLKTKARSRTCPDRSACRDLDCTFGHHCRFGPGCTMENCWFAWTHDMDMVSLIPFALCSVGFT
ncbi:hypothetical protein BDY17DRAFT_122803 [Neohortaea acidophila]|uniref:C-x8-C-x5-C-x3-H type zinc finger protein n=1 Tax=Neohortaea acidophila TaxID=245834 RepID=A0A6A6PXF1_9PEZI|nr:uncharacterized protein BDY17DRAFT_122803 [Neohortaea acidophila]KAF2484173.1 hypothetical protein BDY17DRAFT_122803 [Neohortaea acidophila]